MNPDYMSRTLAYAFHKTDNPGGVTFLGIDVNTLMSEELSELLTMHMNITPEAIEHHNLSVNLMTGLLKLYNDSPFSPVIPVEKGHVYFTSDSSILLDRLSSTLCDEGEGVLIGKPSYATGITGLCKAIRVHVGFQDIDPFSLEAVKLFEDELLQSNRNGINIRMLILSQPNNNRGQYISYLKALTTDVTRVRHLSRTCNCARNIKYTSSQTKRMH